MKPGYFPRTHLILVAVLSLGLCSFVVAKFNDEPDAQRFTSETVLDALPDEELLENQPPIETNVAEMVAEEVIPAAPKVGREVSHTVAKGESLAIIFKDAGVGPQVLHQLANSEPFGKRLRNIFPGHEVSFAFNEQDELILFSYTPGPLERLEFERVGDKFSAREVVKEPTITTAYAEGAIEHSLFLASQRAGLSDSLTMELAQVFQWDIDFVLDIRQGDAFSLIYEEKHLDGEYLGHGRILAAEFINQGDVYRAVRYTDNQGRSSFYDPEGRNMRKAFLRAPVSFSRISSNFNLRRVHPLFKRVMPHRGIDYAAPSGTPVMASGDGRVNIASRTKANGNYVVIHHGEQFQTKYLHLTRFAKGIRKGAKVEQGQVIGYVGATGWATAPHLHYEFLVNGVHKNPRTVKFPNAKPVADQERSRFQTLTQPLLAELSQRQSDTETNMAAAR